jgi:hypothetical protein
MVYVDRHQLAQVWVKRARCFRAGSNISGSFAQKSEKGASFPLNTKEKVHGPAEYNVIVPSRQLHRDKILRHFNKPVSSSGFDGRSRNERLDCYSSLIVVCNGEKDKSLVRLSGKTGISTNNCICSHNCGVSRAWNMGRMLAEGETLVLINDDVRIGKGALEKMHEVLTSNQTSGRWGRRRKMGLLRKRNANGPDKNRRSG